MRTRFSEKEHTGAGLALALILLLANLAGSRPAAIIAMVCILLLMVKPVVFYPFTIIWLNLSDLLGKVTSRVLLTVIYLVMVVPVGLIRKIAGKDSLMLKGFKRSDESAFKIRNHKFSKEDLLNPF